MSKTSSILNFLLKFSVGINLFKCVIKYVKYLLNTVRSDLLLTHFCCPPKSNLPVSSYLKILAELLSSLHLIWQLSLA